jgi:hypothetical protein
VAALVALRAEVAAVRRGPVVELGPAVPLGEPLDGQSTDDRGGAVRGGVVGVLRRIDAVTAAVVEAASSGPRRSPQGREHPSREHSARP